MYIFCAERGLALRNKSHGYLAQPNSGMCFDRTLRKKGHSSRTWRWSNMRDGQMQCRDYTLSKRYDAERKQGAVVARRLEMVADHIKLRRQRVQYLEC
jgi:hypothetical protein